MGLWNRLFHRERKPADEQPTEKPPAADAEGNTVPLSAEPFVFECQMCGKVFEARRKRPQCPECDSTEVQLLTDN